MVKKEDYKQLERSYLKLLEDKSTTCWYCLDGVLEFDGDSYNPRTKETVTVLCCNHCGAIWEGSIIEEY